MWKVVSGPELVAPTADHRRIRFVVRRDEEVREVFVEISGTAEACDPDALPWPISEDVRTNGLHAVERYIVEGNPPAVIRITTNRAWPHIVPAYSDS